MAPTDIEMNTMDIETEKIPAHSVEEKDPIVFKGEKARIELSLVAEKHLVRKCDLRVAPVLFFLYMLSFLDRINIGNAKIQGLQKDLKLSGSQYNVALLIFFVPYILLEVGFLHFIHVPIVLADSVKVPSNIAMKKVRPSTWLSGLAFCWGTILLCFSASPRCAKGLLPTLLGWSSVDLFLGSLKLVPFRVIIIFPPRITKILSYVGCVYLMSFYYKRMELQKRFAFFFCSGFVAGGFSGLLAFALVKLDGYGGYSGWRWIFIIEGLATIAYAVLAKCFIVDWPEDASFLTAEEKLLLSRRLDEDRGNEFARMDRLNKQSFNRIMKDWKIWAGVLMYLGISTSGFSISFFLPTIINGFGYKPGQAQLHTVPVYAVCAVVTLSISWLSDRLKHRYTFTMIGILIASIGYIILLAQGQPHTPHALSNRVKYLATFFVATGTYIKGLAMTDNMAYEDRTQPLVIVWLSNNLGGHYKRAFGTAMQIGFGNLSGIIGSFIFIQNEGPGFKTGYGSALGMVLVCGVACTVFHFGLRWENGKRERGERNDRLTLCEAEVQNLGDDHPGFRFWG
ncbi:hypothetical protein HYFRA_00005907 [Hymenoscyphus fraxineus]|uniref:MFS general substrate transporter n=1 Tax=Hymenoscyphus fraxineus TaxID=746836 RepID=A0A9N9KWB6_9HELO|nr:hypothetical protein HYFRA_00005907 [Hymenoscyphus fraxineus]